MSCMYGTKAARLRLFCLCKQGTGILFEGHDCNTAYEEPYLMEDLSP